MTYIQRALPYATGLTGVILVALSIQAMSTKPITAWTSTSIAFFLVLLVGGLWITLRERSDIFATITALLGTLVVGRLFSTMRFEAPGGEALSSIDPLLVAETGPGLPAITYMSTLLVGLLTLHLAMAAWRHSSGKVARSFIGRTTASDWGMTLLRIYVGLMFVAHFSGHLFAGPVPFAVFTDYFGSIGLPYPAAFVILAGLIELAVTVGLAFGFMTRIAAVGAAVYLFVSVGLGGHFAVGYVWVLPTGGWEFPALWIFALSLFALTGGGPVSVDAWLKDRFSHLPRSISLVVA